MNDYSCKTYKFSFKVGDETKLFQYLKKNTPFSIKMIKRSIEHGQCKINNRTIYISTYKLKYNDKIQFYANSHLIHPHKLVIDKGSVIYEDNILMAVNKPPYFPSDCQKQKSPSVIAELKKYYKNHGEENVTLLHRLDQDTSGILLVSKDITYEEKFLFQFKNHRVNKTYLALTDGIPAKNQGTIESYIGLSKKTHGKQKWGNVQKKYGKFAKTHYKIKTRYKKCALLELYPLTGRTHQIRIHLASIDCPVAGDGLYGKSSSTIFPQPPRQMLHSYKLEIMHPIMKKMLKIKADIPSDFKNYLILQGKTEQNRLTNNKN